MAYGLLGIVTTFGLAWVSAGVFLALRCHREGRLFGPSSRWWALAAVALTSGTSTIAAFAGVALMRVVPPFVLGIVVPSGLWLSNIERIGRRRPEERHGRIPEVPTLGLALLLDRLHQAMADDRLTWCESRVDQMWNQDQLLAAARYYHAAVKERLPTRERRSARLDARIKAIEGRLDMVRFIEDGASAAKVRAELRARARRERRYERYERYRDDLMRLAALLRHDAEQELIRLLDIAYRFRFYRLKGYAGATREPRVGSVAELRPHP
ncbi:MAG TPA: hypothetical protein VE465_08920 [Streptosporangiaceae bacterium]|jgi:hypothetical protein|nr:hypothetical protein [Streptosporangiaceae bacterium]